MLLHDRLIGRIIEEPSNGVIAFSLRDDYLDDPARAVLGQRFEDGHRVQTFRVASHPGRLPSFFANLLPEGALQAMVRSQQATAGDLGTLAHVGENLPGAVVVRFSAGEVEPMARGVSFDEPALGPVLASEAPRFSLAGVQPKLSADRLDDGRFVVRSRTGDWILKFGSTPFETLPRNEHTVMRWASLAGIEIPVHHLVRAGDIDGLDPRFASGDDPVFAIRRYDRLAGGARVHQEDFAQVRGAHPDGKYKNASYEALARLIGDLCGEEDLREYLRRMVFMILSGNYDAHLKNWSLIYPDRRQARLSPAYDLVFVAEYPFEPTLALTLAKEVLPSRIEWSHLRRIERYLHDRGHPMAVVAEARTFVARTMDAWSTLRPEADPSLRSRIDRYLESIPLSKP
ncbi:MAG: type II toxin-antitoxin system HipA family toxin [Deltaproteobacteria bacterium]|nr:type II toxin-antitoxin system HipA family toxin [Deltaproteobacteria bacterium]